MNGAFFNMLLLLGVGLATLVGEAIYRRIVTRAESRRSKSAR